MKKLRDRLNKKGFTLVELIVVIVIILILAAALVPNVMRYIKQARVSAFQAEASAYLVEVQGFEAEYYGKENKNLDKLPPSGGAAYAGMVLSDFADPDTNFHIDSSKFTSGTTTTGKVNITANTKEIYVTFDKGVVTAFSYSDGKHFVNWTQTGGWDDVDVDPT